MGSEMQERVARAMEARRAELIARPLARVWDELAIAAMEAMREPNTRMLAAAQAAWLDDPERRTSTLYRAMLNAAIEAAKKGL